MITCSKCGRENEDQFKFCLGCGSNLEEQRAQSNAAPAAPANCPQCGTPVTPGQRFCGGCGYNVEAHAKTVLPVAAPAAAPSPSPAGPPPPAAPPSPTPSQGQASVAAPAAGPYVTPSTGAPVVGELIKINPDGSPGESHKLHPGDNIIGRSHSNPLFSSDEFLSPQHANFHVTPGQIRLVDLRSENGLFRRIGEPTELQHGDMLRIGQELLRFELMAQAERLLPASTDGTLIAGSPAAGAWGRLERVSAPGEASFIFVLRGTEQFIGRERGDILFRDDGYVSGRHARVFSDGQGRYFIEDLGSSNGTFIRIRGEVVVNSGTLILMGKQPFRIQLH